MMRVLHVAQLVVRPLILLLSLSCGEKERDQPARAADTTTQQGQEEAAHNDDHDETETRLTLSDTAMRTAGIRIDTVTAGASAGSRTLVVPGQVQFDPRRV